jgi:CRP/FNR family cyclic AMP-dependent transcriptional regulator
LARARKRKSVFDPQSVIAARGHGQVRKRFTVGQVIYSQGAPADAAFFVESGCIKESTIVRNGGEAVIALCGPGEFFGTRFFMNRFRRKGLIEYGLDGRIRVHHSLRSTVVED